MHFVDVPFKKDPLSDDMMTWEYRSIPIFWPHELLRNLFEIVGVQIPASELQNYWMKAREHGLPWAREATNDEVLRIPLKLFGDDATYNKQGDKLLGIMISCPLWRPRSGRCSRWPVACISLYGNLGFPTLQPILKEVVWSLNCSFNIPTESGLLFQVTEVGGDWKYMRESLNMRTHWNSPNDMCHFCRIKRIDFPSFPEPLPERSMTEFICDVMDGTWPSPIVLLRRFSMSVLQWCLLHNVHLGLLWTANGGALDYIC